MFECVTHGDPTVIFAVLGDGGPLAYIAWESLFEVPYREEMMEERSRIAGWKRLESAQIVSARESMNIQPTRAP